jgi:hypothetical protein
MTGATVLLAPTTNNIRVDAIAALTRVCRTEITVIAICIAATAARWRVVLVLAVLVDTETPFIVIASAFVFRAQIAVVAISDAVAAIRNLGMSAVAVVTRIGCARVEVVAVKGGSAAEFSLVVATIANADAE